MNSKLKFKIINKNEIEASIVVINQEKKSYTVAINNNQYNLLHYATEYAFKNNIKISKKHVTKDNEKYDIIIFDKANLITSSFHKDLNNNQIKNYKLREIAKKGAVIGAFTIIGGLTLGNIKGLNNNDNSKNENTEVIKITEENENKELYSTAGIEREIEKELKKLNITFKDIAKESKTNNEIVTNSFEEDSEKEQVTEKEIETVQEEPVIDKADATYTFNYEDRSNDECVYNSEKHMEVFDRFSKMYGIDSKLLMAIMAQESGGIHHEYSQNGYAIGGMQIENFWYDKKLTAYNFDIQDYETITVAPNDLKEIYYNVKVAAMILQNNLHLYNYDLLKSVQAYNMGTNWMDKVGDNWNEARLYSEAGDKEYYEHVLSFLPDGTTLIMIKEDGTPIDIKVDNTNTNVYESPKTK